MKRKTFLLLMQSLSHTQSSHICSLFRDGLKFFLKISNLVLFGIVENVKITVLRNFFAKKTKNKKKQVIQLDV